MPRPGRHGGGARQADHRGRARRLPKGLLLTPDSLLRLLGQVRDGALTPEQGAARLSALPYEEMGYAKIDHHRELRTGMPEVIYGAGKTDLQVAEIFERMAAEGGNVLATRVSPAAAAAVLARRPQARHHPVARAVTLRQREAPPPAGTVAVLCAGTSDIPVAEEAEVTLALMGHAVASYHDVGVAGLHRLLAHRSALMEARVIIACAGMEGALPSVVAGLVGAPVIAVPTSVGYGAALGGVAALLGMLNACAPNIGVVNIDNGFGAACLAHAMLRVRAG